MMQTPDVSESGPELSEKVLEPMQYFEQISFFAFEKLSVTQSSLSGSMCAISENCSLDNPLINVP